MSAHPLRNLVVLLEDECTLCRVILQLSAVRGVEVCRSIEAALASPVIGIDAPLIVSVHRHLSSVLQLMSRRIEVLYWKTPEQLVASLLGGNDANLGRWTNLTREMVANRLHVLKNKRGGLTFAEATAGYRELLSPAVDLCYLSRAKVERLLPLLNASCWTPDSVQDTRDAFVYAFQDLEIDCRSSAAGWS